MLGLLGKENKGVPFIRFPLAKLQYHLHPSWLYPIPKEFYC
jgi:hypothetical protein